MIGYIYPNYEVFDKEKANAGLRDPGKTVNFFFFFGKFILDNERDLQC